MRLVSGLLFLLANVATFAQPGALTVPRNIADLSRQAATIVRGQVILARVEPHPELTNLSTIVVTLRVSETLKGNAVPVLTFRQFMWDIRDKYRMGGYTKGQEVLLLLNPVSSYGLTSPAGMDQGRFVISRDAKGNATAVNGYGNVGLFAGVTAQKRKPAFSPAVNELILRHRSGAIPLAQLEEVVRQFAGTL